MKTEMEYQMRDFPFGLPSFRFNVPKGSIPSDKQKCQPKAQHVFTIKGVKIMAASKKVANEKNTLGLRLIPLYLYPSLPIGITLTSIGGKERVFDGSNISTDVRFGCLAWGIKPRKD